MNSHIACEPIDISNLYDKDPNFKVSGPSFETVCVFLCIKYHKFCNMGLKNWLILKNFDLRITF